MSLLLKISIVREFDGDADSDADTDTDADADADTDAALEPNSIQLHPEKKLFRSFPNFCKRHFFRRFFPSRKFLVH